MTLVERLRADEIEGGLFKLELRYEAADRIEEAGRRIQELEEEIERLLRASALDDLVAGITEENRHPEFPSAVPEEVREAVGWLRANSYPDDYIMHEKVMTACDLLEQQAHLLTLAVEHWEGEARPRIEALERENEALKEALRFLDTYVAEEGRTMVHMKRAIRVQLTSAKTAPQIAYEMAAREFKENYAALASAVPEDVRQAVAHLRRGWVSFELCKKYATLLEQLNQECAASMTEIANLRDSLEQQAQEIERLKAELHVIPPGGVDSRCILHGCHENKRHRQ
jgi:hypothetical protein